MKEFNTTALCIPSKHYMVDITDRVREMHSLVDAGKYLVFSKSRQYGKTTTLYALRQALEDDYQVISLSFEGLTHAGFQSEGEFVQAFSRLLLDRHEFFGLNIPDVTLHTLTTFVDARPEQVKMDELYRMFRRWIVASSKPLVLLIDEVDSETNNQVFIDFLGLLRDGYIGRETDGAPAFQSVVLAGVTDIGRLKKTTSSDSENRQNIPWNVAADLPVDMSLSMEGIEGMLNEYEADHHVGMDTASLARLIHDYTSGYPFLVSRICQLVDTEVSATLGLQEAWTKRGVDEAVKTVLAEENTLFQSLTKNLNDSPVLNDALRSILIEGTSVSFNPSQEDIAHMQMLGLIQNDHGTVRVANWIFEALLYNLFLSDEELKNSVFSRKGSFARKRLFDDGEVSG